MARPDRSARPLAPREPVDLTRDAATQTVWTGGYQVTSAPAIANDLVIVGSSLADNWRVDHGRGIVRAFDARTGSLRWTWDPIPWAKGTEPRTGGATPGPPSPSTRARPRLRPDGQRQPGLLRRDPQGRQQVANSVVALRASTGRFVWGFQVVHHDLWDYDVASQPALIAWKDRTPAVGDQHKMGRVLRAEPPHRGSPASGRRAGRAARATFRVSKAGRRSRPRHFARARTAPARRCLGADARGPQVVPGQDQGIEEPGHLHPPGSRARWCFPATWARQLGQRRLRSAAPTMVVNTNRLAAWVKLIPRGGFDAEPMLPRTIASS